MSQSVKLDWICSGIIQPGIAAAMASYVGKPFDATAVAAGNAAIAAWVAAQEPGFLPNLPVVYSCAADPNNPNNFVVSWSLSQ